MFAPPDFMNLSLRLRCRAVGEHGAVRQVGGHAGQQRGPHGSVPRSVPAGRGGGEDRPAAPGPGQRRLLPLLRVTGRLRSTHQRRQGTTVRKSCFPPATCSPTVERQVFITEMRFKCNCNCVLKKETHPSGTFRNRKE